MWGRNRLDGATRGVVARFVTGLWYPWRTPFGSTPGGPPGGPPRRTPREFPRRTPSGDIPVDTPGDKLGTPQGTPRVAVWVAVWRLCFQTLKYTETGGTGISEQVTSLWAAALKIHQRSPKDSKDDRVT